MDSTMVGAWKVDRHGPVAMVVFTRPPENLMTYLLLAELDELLASLANDLSVTVVVITGGVDGYFVGHADLADVEQLVNGPDPAASGRGSAALRRSEQGDPDAWGRALARMASIPQPVVAAVNGQAWGGGCELALGALMRVASPAAHFSFVEVAAGAIPGAGGTQRLPRLVGAARAARMILTGEVVGADEALAMGLVDAVCSGEDFLTDVLAWVQPIASQPRHTVVAVKRAMVDGLAMSLADGLANEQRLFRAVLTSPESRAMFAAHEQPGG